MPLFPCPVQDRLCAKSGALWQMYGRGIGYRPSAGFTTMLLELNKEHLGALRRALEARARDMHLRLGSDPGDDGFRREAALATQLLRQVEALERRARGQGSPRQEFRLTGAVHAVPDLRRDSGRPRSPHVPLALQKPHWPRDG